MQRIIHRQVTTIQITSIEVLWDEDRHPFPHEILDAEIVTPLLPEPKPRKTRKKTKSATGKKTGAHSRRPAATKRVAGESASSAEFILKIQE